MILAMIHQESTRFDLYCITWVHWDGINRKSSINTVSHDVLTVSVQFISESTKNHDSSTTDSKDSPQCKYECSRCFYDSIQFLYCSSTVAHLHCISDESVWIVVSVILRFTPKTHKYTYSTTRNESDSLMEVLPFRPRPLSTTIHPKNIFNCLKLS